MIREYYIPGLAHCKHQIRAIYIPREENSAFSPADSLMPDAKRSALIIQGRKHIFPLRGQSTNSVKRIKKSHRIIPELPLCDLMRLKVNRLLHKNAVEPKAKGAASKRDQRKLKRKIRISGPFPGFRRNLLDYLVEYSNNSSIQGVRYIGEQSRPIFERITWLIFFCISLYFCIHLIIQTYNKWDSAPVLVSFSTSPTPVWKVPFPAITICSETKSRQTVYNFTAVYHKLVDKTFIPAAEFKTFCDLMLTCDHTIYHGGNYCTGYDTIEKLMHLAQPPEEMIYHCQFYTTFLPCQSLFTPILTEEGICYTFNMLDRSEIFRDNVFVYGNLMTHAEKSGGWTMGKGYPTDAPIDTYPRRSLSAGFQFRFVIVLRTLEENLDYICRGPVQGYKIILHNPAETPRVGMQYFRASLDQEANFVIRPDMMTTSEGLRGYHPQRRQCYFPEERYLAFFLNYTQQNCEEECLTNFTLNKCGCVSLHMAHEKDTPRCGSASIKCMIQARYELAFKEVQSNIDEDDLGLSGPSKCGCLPGCTSLVYHAEILQTEFDLDKLAAAHRMNTSQHRGIQLTRIFVHFEEQQFITSRRNELYGQNEFISNCGGLLGLFTGFSFLSLIEICYFLTLRLIGNVMKYGKHYWSGSQELVNNEEFDHRI